MIPRDLLRVVALLVFILSTSGLRAEESCSTIHGRLHYYGGDGQLRIWVIGTHHEFTPDESSWDTVIGWLRDGVKPSKRSEYADPATAVDLYGDFQICPTEVLRKGAVQHAKVKAVTNRRYVKSF